MVLILQDAFHAKKLFAIDHEAIFFVKLGIHNNIRNSCLIFKTQKDEALRCSRPLPSDYASGDPRVLPVWHPRQIARSFYLQLG